MAVLNFAGKDIPDFVIVGNLHFGILPTLSTTPIEVNGRAGNYDQGTRIGTRTIEVDITIVTPNDNEVMAYARELADWLFHEEVQPLIISDDPDKYYNARVDGDTQISELLNHGTATITFLCPDPFAYSKDRKFETDYVQSPNNDEPLVIDNQGTAETYPVIQTFLENDSSLVAITNGSEFLELGLEDIELPEKEIDPRVFYDRMESVNTGWTTADSVDNGLIRGSFESNGYSFRQADGDYGLPDVGEDEEVSREWRGASLIKSLDRSVQDFTASFRFGFDARSSTEIGRIEFYLLDENNSQIGKIRIGDFTPGTFAPKMQARIGNYSGGLNIADTYGSSKGSLSDTPSGTLELNRRGNEWEARIAKRDDNGNEYDELTYRYVDTQERYTSSRLAKIQIHIATLGSLNTVHHMNIQHIEVREPSHPSDFENSVPLFFKAGEMVEFDCQRGIVSVNGKTAFQLLNVGSEFFSLKRGENHLMTYPRNAETQVFYRERWL